VEVVIHLLRLAQAAQGQLREKDVTREMTPGLQIGIDLLGGGPIPLEGMRDGHGPHGREAEGKVVGVQVLEGAARLDHDGVRLVAGDGERGPSGGDAADKVVIR